MELPHRIPQSTSTALPQNPATRRRFLQTMAGAAAVAAASPLGVRAQGTPPPAATPAAPGEEEVTFNLSGGVTTRGVFAYPTNGTPPFPAVLLLQGSGPTDRDETLFEPDGTMQQPFVKIAEALAQHGIASFRFDKRGVSPPSTIADAEAYAQQTRPVLTEDAGLAYEEMVANSRIDADRTAVLGHSEGTWLAPYLPAMHPQVRALVLVATGLGPMHALTFSQVTLPLLGLVPYDTDDDGAIAPEELAFTDPAAAAEFQARIRVQGQLLLLRYEGTGQDLRPVGLNMTLDTNGDGKLDLLTEVRPAYEAFLAGIAHPLAVVEQYADPSVLDTARAALAAAEAQDAALYASYQAEPMDQSLRTLLALPDRPAILIVNGEHDDQTPASSATLLGERLEAAGYTPAPTVTIYPGLSHVLSPQESLFAPYGADMQPEPIADIAVWLNEAIGE